MAFFSDGNCEYFSLNLDPLKNERSFVYKLTARQTIFSQNSIPALLMTSIIIGAFILIMCAMEFLGLISSYINNATQELLVLFLAGAATLVGFTEIFFFFWIKRNKLPLPISEYPGIAISFSISNGKSWMAYLIFLISMLIPFISLLALPGGYSDLIKDMSDQGTMFCVLLVQLIVTVIAFSVFLARRVITLRSMRDRR